MLTEYRNTMAATGKRLRKLDDACLNTTQGRAPQRFASKRSAIP